MLSILDILLPSQLLRNPMGLSESRFYLGLYHSRREQCFRLPVIHPGLFVPAVTELKLSFALGAVQFAQDPLTFSRVRFVIFLE